jgi:hypothetical protein
MANAVEMAGSASADGFITETARRAAELDRAERARRKQALDLQRENILSQRTSHPARRAALSAALEQIEAQLAALG